MCKVWEFYFLLRGLIMDTVIALLYFLGMMLQLTLHCQSDISSFGLNSWRVADHFRLYKSRALTNNLWTWVAACHNSGICRNTNDLIGFGFVPSNKCEIFLQYHREKAIEKKPLHCPGDWNTNDWTVVSVSGLSRRSTAVTVNAERTRLRICLLLVS